METTYSKPILIAAVIVAVGGVAALLWVLNPEPAPQPETSTTAPTLSHEEKVKVMQDLAASSDTSANLSVEKKAQVLQKTHSPSVPSNEAARERQMEILRSLRYSE